jgi:hypothetical protein
MSAPESTPTHLPWTNNPMPESALPYTRVAFISQSGTLELASGLSKDSKYIKYSKNIEEGKGEFVFVRISTVSCCADTRALWLSQSRFQHLSAFWFNQLTCTQCQMLTRWEAFLWQLVFAGKAAWDMATRGRYLLSNKIRRCKAPNFLIMTFADPSACFFYLWAKLIRTDLNYVKSINQLGDFLCSLFTIRNNFGNGSWIKLCRTSKFVSRTSVPIYCIFVRNES